MSGLRERLGRLRADSTTTASTPESLANTRTPSGSDASPTPTADAGTSHEQWLAHEFRKLGVELHGPEGAQFLLRRSVYPLPYRHGRHELAHLMTCAEQLRPIAVRQNGQSEPIDVFKLLFLDTETTGLGVGTGNVPFMIGFGYYTEHAFVVEQALIRHPGEEKAMLTYLLGHMKDKTHLVTYNGRTFDWPVLINRFILNGWRRSGPEPGHLDFLHPSRALWRNTLTSCRLGIIEEARLGIHREHDVPGSLAPTLYFQYLNDPNPLYLQGVYIHNEKDVLTLASLAVHFGLLLGGMMPADEKEQPQGEELYRTACWLEQHGNLADAERLFTQLNELEDTADSSGWSLALAARYKRMGQYERALPLWIRAAEKAEKAMLPRLEAHVELAMYYEHRSKQLLMALNYSEKALELVNRRMRMSRDAAKRKEEKDALLHRVTRLRKKVNV
jgi:uncharacterized protein YprB with RNaseH-like and TPR domain